LLSLPKVYGILLGHIIVLDKIMLSVFL